MTAGPYFPSLLTWRDEDGDRTIATASEWEERRRATRRLLVDLLGGVPEPPGPGQGRRLERRSLGSGGECWRVVYEGGTGEEIPAYLLVPERLEGPAPAVLAVHGTSLYGKDIVVDPTHGPRPAHLSQAGHLLARGFVVLAPDLLTFGERIAPGRPYVDTTAFYAAHPGWSMYGKIVYDLRRAVDYLYTLDFVDKGRICVMGHSLGGHSGFFTAALEPRITACVSSCGLYPWIRPEQAFRWARPRPERFIYLPRLRDYLVTGKAPPVDMHEAIALIAPRAFYNQSADEGLPEMEGMLAEVATRVKEVYRLLGAEDQVRFDFRFGAHAFTEEGQRAAADWLAAQLTR
jgi:dienelactone hydrolase